MTLLILFAHRRRIAPRANSALRRVMLFIITVITGLPALAPAAVIHVPSDHATIQSAILAAADGDEIIVWPGTYNENILMLGKNVDLHSLDPRNPAVVAQTIIDGTGLPWTIRFSGRETLQCRVAGFTITNTPGPNNSGDLYYIGAIDCPPQDFLLYPDAYFPTPVIEYNVITNNIGSGLARIGGIIRYNTICNNIGAGMFAAGGLIHNNVIYGNTTGIRQSMNVIVTNNVIFENPPADEYHRGGIVFTSGLVANNIIWNNTTGDIPEIDINSSIPIFSCIRGWTGGGLGNISADPLFVNPAAGDFHLQPESPCINAGNYLYLTWGHFRDMDGESRLAGPQLDIGADETSSGVDTDGDLIPDWMEASYHGTVFDNADSDGDGLPDGIELLRGTNPAVADVFSGIAVTTDSLTLPLAKAVFVAAPGETITAAPGTYPVNLFIPGRAVILTSQNPHDPATVAATTLDGGAQSSVITLSGFETAVSRIEGLTITNGRSIIGAGINGNGARAAILHNRISDNVSSGERDIGAGIHNNDGEIAFNLMQGNSEISALPNFHRGSVLAQCDGFIHNNRITDNAIGGIQYSWGTIQNNLIARNSATALRYCHGTILSNTIAFNGVRESANTGGMDSCNAFAANNIVWGNAKSNLADSDVYLCSIPMYSCIEGWTGGGEGNIASDPTFVDAANDDFHLAPDSPCINAGRPHLLAGNYWSDLDGEKRITGPGIDIGADETSSAPDSDGDLIADADEAALETNPTLFDTDSDGIADGAELLRSANPIIPDAPAQRPGTGDEIQQLIFTARPGDEIILDSANPNYGPVHMLGRAITLRGPDPADWATVEQTILEGNTFNPVVSCLGTEGTSATLRGIKIQNGHGTTGGGVKGDQSLINILQCIIQNNTTLGRGARGDGAGIFGVNGLISENRILDNFAQFGYFPTPNSSSARGGGLAHCHGLIEHNLIARNSTDHETGGLWECNGTISDNVITSNTSHSFGGGIGGCNGIIINNDISGNIASLGAGFVGAFGLVDSNLIHHNVCGQPPGTSSFMRQGAGLYQCDALIQNNLIYINRVYAISAGENEAIGAGIAASGFRIVNNTVWGNAAYTWDEQPAGKGTGIAWPGGFTYPHSKLLEVSNNIVWANVGYSTEQVYLTGLTPNYNIIQDWTGGGVGNLTGDPLLADPVSGDFHITAGSPAIDAGNNIPWLARDFEGDPRPRLAGGPVGGDGSGFDIGADEFPGTPPDPTPTPTPSPTPTASPSPSPTPDPTPTPTPTPTASLTPSPTPTLTATPTPTLTPTHSPTATPSSTPTPEPSATGTPIPSPTPTPDMSATPSPTATATPTFTPPPTPSPSPTATITPTPTPEPMPAHGVVIY